MDAREAKLIEGLEQDEARPMVLDIFDHFETRMDGSRFRVSLPGILCCRRTPSDQMGLYMQGRRAVATLDGPRFLVVGKVVTWCDGYEKPSYHQSGRAVDIGIRDTWTGEFVWYDPDSEDAPHAWFRELAGYMKAMGFEWGGDWPKRKKDWHHFQLPKEREAHENRE